MLIRFIQTINYLLLSFTLIIRIKYNISVLITFKFSRNSAFVVTT